MNCAPWHPTDPSHIVYYHKDAEEFVSVCAPAPVYCRSVTKMRMFFVYYHVQAKHHHHHHHHHHSLSFLRESPRHHRDHVWESVLPCSHVLAKLYPSGLSKRGRGERQEAVECERAYLISRTDARNCVGGAGSQSTNIKECCVRISADADTPTAVYSSTIKCHTISPHTYANAAHPHPYPHPHPTIHPPTHPTTVCLRDHAPAHANVCT